MKFKTILSQIWNASDLKTVYPLLEKIVNEIEKMIMKKNPRFEETQEITACLTHIRVLITELSRTKGSDEEHEKYAAMLQELKSRCLDLEGVIKEIRNDFYREKNFKR